MTHIYDPRNYLELELNTPEVDVGQILKLDGCQMFTIELLKLEWTYESFPTAWGLRLCRAVIM